MNPLDLQDADSWIEEAGKIGGLKAELQAVQGVIAAQTLRYQWVGEGDVSELYPWYTKHLLRLHETAEKIAPRGDWASVPFRLGDPSHFDDVVVMMTIRAILATLPEVSSDEDELEYIPVDPETRESKG